MLQKSNFGVSEFENSCLQAPVRIAKSHTHLRSQLDVVEALPHSWILNPPAIRATLGRAVLQIEGLKGKGAGSSSRTAHPGAHPTLARLRCTCSGRGLKR